jgi:hypothetical protein
VDSIFKTASGITTMWGLAAFAIAAILYFTRRRGANSSHVTWIVIAGIVVLALIPTISWTQLERDKVRNEAGSIYRLRVTVLNPDKIPVEDAHVWSSTGGEPKRVAGGWQFDIPAATKPADGKLTVYATVANAFWRGSRDVHLSNDLYPNATIQLGSDTTVIVRGLVLDETGRAVRGARVTVSGYADEVTTKPDGSFELPAHAARGQQVLLHAEKQGYRAVTQWHPAGESPATLILETNSRRK